ncbi:hypothetical protein, partial [Escherichia coli]|uniref:hypothetical protein n=1 Tax=Escherichia coli TaxID=562 RepID=UPI001952D75A
MPVSGYALSGHGPAGTNGLKTPGGAAAYRGYSAVRFGSPEKAQRAASGKTPVRQKSCQPMTVSTTE